MAYFAGFFDGEGSVGIYADGFHRSGEPLQKLKVTVSQSGHEMPLVLELFRERFGGSITRQMMKERPVPAWHWRQGDLPAAEFLRLIEPFVVVKRSQVLLALEFAELVREVKGLPRRGPNAMSQRRADLIVERAVCATRMKGLKHGAI